MPEARLLRGEQAAITGRGLVVRLKAETGSHVRGESHQLGTLCQPLFVFTGALEGAEPGDVLEQDGQRYTVLKAERMEIAGTVLGVRLTMERRVETDDCP